MYHVLVIFVVFSDSIDGSVGYNTLIFLYFPFHRFSSHIHTVYEIFLVAVLTIMITVAIICESSTLSA